MPTVPNKAVSLADKLRGVKPDRFRKEPLWRGPCAKGPLGGITFSMLGKWLGCRERFRVTYVEGLRPAESFNHRIEYGNMWHVCEEELARGGSKPIGPGNDDWCRALKQYCSSLCREYQTQQQQVEHWYNVCKIQFPLYVDHWSKHPDVKGRTPLMQEHVFDVSYKLPSGRIVRLRGKFDAVDLIAGEGVYLQENKSKGDVDTLRIQRQLRFDLQTMMYLTALCYGDDLAKLGNKQLESFVRKSGAAIAGVRYNVVRRPLSGGKGSIVRHKPTKKNPEGESAAAYYGRLSGIISDSPEDFFWRWKARVNRQEVDQFRERCFDPLLESLCDWYEWIEAGPTNDPWSPRILHEGGTPEPNRVHHRHPFGLFNVLDEGGATEYDEHLETGSTVGLVRIDKLFRELA